MYRYFLSHGFRCLGNITLVIIIDTLSIYTLVIIISTLSIYTLVIIIATLSIYTLVVIIDSYIFHKHAVHGNMAVA